MHFETRSHTGDRLMTAPNRIIVSLLLVAISFAVSPASATPITGIAVEDTSSTTQVGNASADGTIGFYINLSGSSTYGVNGGTSSDLCYFPSDCGTGELTMHLFFTGLQPGAASVSLLFTDLDADGVNDPWFFIENLEIYDEDGVLLMVIDESSDFDFANLDNQQLDFDLNVDGDFYISLVFSSAFDPNSANGWYRNTQEFMLATATSIPEPGVLALLGIGLLTIVLSQRRRRRGAS